MYACVVEDATALVDPVAIGVTGQDDAYKISADENIIINALIMTRSQLSEMKNVSKLTHWSKEKQQKQEVVRNLWCLQIYINPL